MLNAPTPTVLITAVIIAGISYAVYSSIFNIFLHPLSQFPGPRAAAITLYWKAYVECVQGRSFCHVLKELHNVYGDVVRVGPNELHFSNPHAYHDIYNNRNRWDKERRFYHSFDEDESSFGFITYKEAKERRDILSRSFSNSAIEQAEGLMVDKVTALCAAFIREGRTGGSIDLFRAFRCMTADIVTYFCFGQSINAINAPGFDAPIIDSLDFSFPIFIRFKYSTLYKNMILKCPPEISRIISPSTRALVNLQIILRKQINDLSANPENLKQLPHQLTLYHRLIDRDSYLTSIVPSTKSLYQEAQALMFGGTDTIGNTLMVGSFHLLRQPETLARMKEELYNVWESTSPQEPGLRILEKAPFLNAIIKESLRMASGVVSGLPRIVPAGGAIISGITVPAGAIVSCSSVFVHYNEDLFSDPEIFSPDRWLKSPGLDRWLVSFSRGPRMCFGMNLAMAELRLTFAHVYHKFNVTQAEPASASMPFRDLFLPFYYGPHLCANLKPTTL